MLYLTQYFHKAFKFKDDDDDDDDDDTY